MPLNTQIIRNGETLPQQWSGFHIAAMTLSALGETHPDLRDKPMAEDMSQPITITPRLVFETVNYGVLAAAFPEGEYTLTRDWKWEDANDGEVLELKAGDRLKAWRT